MLQLSLSTLLTSPTTPGAGFVPALSGDFSAALAGIAEAAAAADASSGAPAAPRQAAAEPGKSLPTAPAADGPAADPALAWLGQIDIAIAAVVVPPLAPAAADAPKLAAPISSFAPEPSPGQGVAASPLASAPSATVESEIPTPVDALLSGKNMARATVAAPAGKAASAPSAKLPSPLVGDQDDGGEAASETPEAGRTDIAVLAPAGRTAITVTTPVEAIPAIPVSGALDRRPAPTVAPGIIVDAPGAPLIVPDEAQQVDGPNPKAAIVAPPSPVPTPEAQQAVPVPESVAQYTTPTTVVLPHGDAAAPSTSLATESDPALPKRGSSKKAADPLHRNRTAKPATDAPPAAPLAAAIAVLPGTPVAANDPIPAATSAVHNDRAIVRAPVPASAPPASPSSAALPSTLSDASVPQTVATKPAVATAAGVGPMVQPDHPSPPIPQAAAPAIPAASAPVGAATLPEDSVVAELNPRRAAAPSAPPPIASAAPAPAGPGVPVKTPVAAAAIGGQQATPALHDGDAPAAITTSGPGVAANIANAPQPTSPPAGVPVAPTAAANDVAPAPAPAAPNQPAAAPADAQPPTRLTADRAAKADAPAPPAAAPAVTPMRPAPTPPPAAPPASIVLGVAFRGMTPGERPLGDPRPSPREQALQALTALAGAGPAAPVAAPGQAQHGALDMRRDEWPQAMIDRIEALRDAADATSTRITLAPDALGKVDLSIRHDGGSVHVHFAADAAQTRAILVDAQPRLAELARQRGFRLGQTTVDAGANGGGQRQPPNAAPASPQRPASAFATTPADADAADPTRLA